MGLESTVGYCYRSFLLGGCAAPRWMIIKNSLTGAGNPTNSSLATCLPRVVKDWVLEPLFGLFDCGHQSIVDRQGVGTLNEVNFV